MVTQKGKILHEKAGGARKTTCTRMEFQAAIEALSSFPEGSRIILHTDSRILVDTMTIWVPQWKDLGWRKKHGQEIPDVDLMKALESLNQHHHITWKWIRAHSGIEFNERCDQLCVQARSRF